MGLFKYSTRLVQRWAFLGLFLVRFNSVVLELSLKLTVSDSAFNMSQFTKKKWAHKLALFFPTK
uniref:Uncharacterized protein n=1 Tax=Rhizophora mucronata TaxID=61149 RepID=A0A2P2QD80_RHIMU